MLNSNKIMVDKTLQEIFDFTDDRVEKGHFRILERSFTTANSKNTERLATAKLVIATTECQVTDITSYVAITSDGYLLTTEIMLSDGKRIESDIWGVMSGSYSLHSVFKNMTNWMQDELRVYDYLARNPANVISLITRTMTTQSSIIHDQQRTIGEADYVMSCMYPKTQKTIRDMFSKFYDSLISKGFKQLKQSIVDHKDTPRNKKL